MRTRWSISALLATSIVIVAGCQNQESGVAPTGDAASGVSDPMSSNTVAATSPEAEEPAGDHSGWWCKEHGIPEEICSMCSSEVAADFQKKGDWCEKHDRADSQCFICHPELEAKFAALYIAKFGEQPPPREE